MRTVARIVDDDQGTSKKGARRSKTKQARPAATYERGVRRAAEGAFDRDTGEAVPPDHLMTYREALAQYHLHPEAKFQNADYLDSGATERRHVLAAGIESIGKEANRWEEQFYLGVEDETQIEYGMTPESLDRLRGSVLRAGQRFGQRQVAQAAGVSLSEVSAILAGRRTPRRETLANLGRAVVHLEQVKRERDEQARRSSRRSGSVAGKLGCWKWRGRQVSMRRIWRRYCLGVVSQALVCSPS